MSDAVGSYCKDRRKKMLLFVCERCFVVMTPEGVPLPFPLARERFCSWFFVLLVCLLLFLLLD